MEYKLIQFQQHGDVRGMLVALEESKEVPFTIRRVYYMYDTGERVRRGYHAHRKLQQILICVSGSCKIHLDNGKETEEILLDKPYVGLYLSNNIWREMYDFSEGTVLMVLASELYDEEDYIRDYQKFMKEICEGHLKPFENIMVDARHGCFPGRKL